MHILPLLRVGHIACLLLVTFSGACNKNEGAEVLKKLSTFETSICACEDEACVTTINAELKAYRKSGAIRKPSDKQMSQVMEIYDRVEACSDRFVLSERGKIELDAIEKAEATIKTAVSGGNETEILFACSARDAEAFKKRYADYIKTKPALAKTLDDRIAYCTIGVWKDQVESLVTKAEAARASTPTGKIPECSNGIMVSNMYLEKAPQGAAIAAAMQARFTKVCP